MKFSLARTTAAGAMTAALVLVTSLAEAGVSNPNDYIIDVSVSAIKNPQP